MNFIETISRFEAQNFIAFIALFLAYLAYRKSIYDEFKNWINLIKSFKSELDYASFWIGNSYTSIDPNWMQSSKLVYPLSFESAKAILQKGYPPSEIISQEFLDKLAIFNERIEAFNHLLRGQIFNYTFNNPSKQITKDKALFLNQAIHLQLIGNAQTGTLYSLHRFFEKEVSLILATWKYKIPWHIKNPFGVFILSLFLYFIIDFYL